MIASYIYEGRGQSHRAAEAKNDGRFPKTLAAKELGISVKAFDAGVKNSDIISTEWHHVGKFATPVPFYDTEEYRKDYKFWIGVSTAYIGKKAEFYREIANQCKIDAKLEKIEKFKQWLERRRDCTVYVPKHYTGHNYKAFVLKQLNLTDIFQGTIEESKVYHMKPQDGIKLLPKLVMLKTLRAKRIADRIKKYNVTFGMSKKRHPQIIIGDIRISRAKTGYVYAHFPAELGIKSYQNLFPIKTLYKNLLKKVLTVKPPECSILFT